ncbi:MAG: FlgD immunoglobulin-like domain containing protein [Candidatus Krumholzibacteria bacterium]
MIRFDVPAGGGRVSLRIYDAGGRLVRTLVDANVRTPGERQVMWDGRNTRGRRVASGIYFYRLQGPGFSKTRKMVLVK